MNVQQFLATNRVSFQPMRHRPTFTAQQTAQAVHVRGDEVAKTVVLRADGKYVLAVLQATHKIDLKRLRDTLAARSVDLAAEQEFRTMFPDCEVGALPPFGSQYGLKTIVDEPLTRDPQIVIEGNTHDEAIQMRYDDYARLEQPQVAAFTVHA